MKNTVYFIMTILAATCCSFAHRAYAICDELCDSNSQTTGFGLASLQALTSGSENTAFGDTALTSVTTGSSNTAVGNRALAVNQVDENTAVGDLALNRNVSGLRNAALGFLALELNGNGGDNTAVGHEALTNNVSHSFNTAVGSGALIAGDADDNTALGALALNSDTSGQFNSATGVSALFSNTTGSQNTAGGVSALYFNVAGHDNAADGFQALLHNKGSNNVAVGSNAGANLTTGNNNIDIGANVLGQAGESAKIRIGKQGTQTGTFVAGIYNIAEPAASGIKPVYINSNGQLGTTPPGSSARFKEAIKPMDKSSEAILALKPATFRYKNDEEATPQFGLIAEEVAKADPDLVVRDDEGKVYSVRYEAVNAMLLNEFLKEHQKVEEQKRGFEEKLAAQQRQIELLTAAVQRMSDRVDQRTDDRIADQ
jgi:Chaperone of endosialidase